MKHCSMFDLVPGDMYRICKTSYTNFTGSSFPGINMIVFRNENQIGSWSSHYNQLIVWHVNRIECSWRIFRL